jgi:DNA-binding response OmpR family regulator
MCAAVTEKRRILIVDDEELIVMPMRKYFEGLRYDVDTALELSEAKDLLLGNPYDLVIADLRLTGSGGTEGLDIVSAVQRRSDTTRIILLSAYGTPEIERESYARGADAFLHKPKGMMEIASIARSLLGEG